jgi:nucleoside-diphosphate-sugar epimerase
MRVLITGGCGFVGSVLVPKLLEAGHFVSVVDIMWFGNHLKPHENLHVTKEDVREPHNMGAMDCVVHLAGIANDPTGELDPKLTWEVNVLGTMRLLDMCERAGVKQFIYASSGSVYGVSNDPRVIEETSLNPISEYNKSKMVAERVVLSYDHAMDISIVRPATVCGYSPRMRLDTVVNMFTMQALTTGMITVLGGAQVRPNIHIDDMTDLYLWLIERRWGCTYNAGFENLEVSKIAEMVAQKTGAQIRYYPSNDPRSYRLDSSKLLKAGFKPENTVNDAIDEIIAAYASGLLKDEDRWYNLRSMPKAA